MAERVDVDLQIERVSGRSIVALKVARNAIAHARDRMQLAPSLSASGGDPRSLWVGPDRWLLVSDIVGSEVILERCRRMLARTVHDAVDYSAGLAVFRVVGCHARLLLATATAMDLRPEQFPAGTCCRTRFALIAAVISIEADDRYEVYVDRSYEIYLANWLAESSTILLSYLNGDRPREAGMVPR